MKTKIYLILIPFVIAQFGCSQELKEMVEVTSDSTTISSLPEKFESLNDFALLNYNLNEQTKFQPLHIDINDSNSFTIIGRFSGNKVADSIGNFMLTEIEFAYYEAANIQKPILIKDAWIEKNELEDQPELMTIINIELMDVSNCESDDCNELKNRRNSGEADFRLITNLILKEGSILDFHIINHEEMYPEPQKKFPRGRHCKGTIFFK